MEYDNTSNIFNITISSIIGKQGLDIQEFEIYAFENDKKREVRIWYDEWDIKYILE